MYNGSHLVDKLLCLFAFDTANRADLLVVEQDAVELVCRDEHFRSECRGNELRSGRELVDHSYSKRS